MHFLLLFVGIVEPSSPLLLLLFFSAIGSPSPCMYFRVVIDSGVIAYVRGSARV